MSFWRRRDPRAKAWFALLWSFALAATPGWGALVVLPVPVVLLLTAGIRPRRLFQVLVSVLVLWGLSFAANALFMPGTRVGPEELGWLRPTREGMEAGFSHGARLAGLAFLSAWVVEVTGALEMAGSLEWTFRRNPRLQRTAHRALLPVVLALRMIPLFLDEARRILEVDRLRGGPRKGLRGVRRVARLAPVWMVTTIERAEALGLALSLRGYRPEAARTFLRPYRFGVWDWGLVAAGLAGAGYLGTL